MSELLSTWIKGMASAAVICGAALAITPTGKVKNVLKVLCGAVIVLALLQPFTGGEGLWSAADIARYRLEAEAIAGGAQEERTNMSRTIIEQELEAYILDKALSLGIEGAQAKVTLRWSEEGFWYPYEVSVATPGSFGRSSLESCIAGDLGVPAERQYWSVTE